jgi:hypothetical protein
MELPHKNSKGLKYPYIVDSLDTIPVVTKKIASTKKKPVTNYSFVGTDPK